MQVQLTVKRCCETCTVSTVMGKAFVQSAFLHSLDCTCHAAKITLSVCSGVCHADSTRMMSCVTTVGRRPSQWPTTMGCMIAGWWGLARHFHYLPEILAAFCWTAPALLGQCLPYFYVVFLTLLLTDRAFRDDMRCQSKYGKYWAQYTKSVPYKMVPFVF